MQRLHHVLRAVGTAPTGSVEADALAQIEPRLRGIYEQRDFGENPGRIPLVFRGKWLPGSDGYAVQEGGARARYDVVSGERSLVLESGDPGVGPNEKLREILKLDPGGPVSSGQAVLSPDGTRIAYVQSDSSQVRLRPMLVPGDPSYPDVQYTRFARVGEVIAKLKVGVVPVAGGDTTWLPIPAPPEGYYLGQVGWACNSEEVLVEKLSRFRDEREFLLVHVGTGKISRIFHESDPAWVISSEPHEEKGLHWIQGGKAFIVLSEMDGWRHAYLCSRDGQERKLLTPGDYDVIERVKIDEANGWLYFNASPDNATQKYLYRVPLDASGSSAERVTPKDQPGTHDYEFSPNGRWAFHTYSTFSTPPVTDLVEFPDHRVARVLEDNEALFRNFAALPPTSTEFLQLEIEGGIQMDAWLMKPPLFDPTKKYPVLVYVYGEPHAQTVLDAWGTAHADYHRAIAELGYLVVSIDNRGTPCPKGSAWRRAVAGKLGPLSTEEQAAGLQALGHDRQYVDLTRVCIWGWSGGGSNTLNAMFRKPDVYQAGIAVAPKPQAHLYNAWFQEIYMNTREDNPDGYQQSSAINFADGLSGDLLIIHGTGETNTHLEIVEGLVDRLIELGKPFDYMAYPNRNHGVSEGKGTSFHMRMHMARYLITHVCPGPK